MIKITSLDFWERPEYIERINNLDKSLLNQNGFYYLTHTSYQAGLEYNWGYFEEEGFGQVLNNMIGHIDEAFFELLNVCFEIGKFDSRIILLPEAV